MVARYAATEVRAMTTDRCRHDMVRAWCSLCLGQRDWTGAAEYHHIGAPELLVSYAPACVLCGGPIRRGEDICVDVSGGYICWRCAP